MSVSPPFLLTPPDALQVVLSRIAPLQAETVTFEAALERTLATEVVSNVQLPPFANSAMDGYAVVAADLASATAIAPVALQLLETIGAGEVASQVVCSGFCSKIMTGATLPDGADAVVMREETRQNGTSVAFLGSVKPGENIRLAGSDVQYGEVVLEAGSLINAPRWAMLASLGRAEIEVFRRPRVGIIATGAELVGIDAVLQPGQIRDSNSWALRGLVLQTGVEIEAQVRIGDSPEELLTSLSELAGRCDFIITSGGVSMGDFDPVRDVLQQHAQVHFWKIAMKPGKPVMFAHFEGVPVFGLPGNPVSVMVAFEEFVRPAILKASGRRELLRPTVEVELTEPLRRSAGRTEYVRAQVCFEHGKALAQITGDQGSGRLSNMINANALLIVPPDVENLSTGDKLMARLLQVAEA